MSAQDNIRIANKMYENFNKRNIEDSYKYVSDNVTLNNIPFGTSLKGREGLKQALGMWSNTFSDAKVNIKNMIASDDYVVTEFTGTGTHDGVLETPDGRINPSHNKVNIPFVEVVQFKNGKVVSSNLYYDTVTIMQQLGLNTEKVK